MKVTLGSVASYINGFAFKPTDWSTCGLKIIRIQNLTNPTSEANYYSGTYDLKYEVNRGDVLISWSASLGIYIWQDEKAVLNQHIFKVVFDKVSLNKKYFFYQVSYILKRAESETHGATMKHLTRPVFNALPFELPSMEQQNFIANELDIIARLINAHKRQLHLLDELVKSRFIEMFGDLANPQCRYYKCKLEELCSSPDDIKCGPFGTQLNKDEYQTEGVAIWEIPQINSGFNMKPTHFLTNEKARQLKAYSIRPGDIAMSRKGNVGKCALFPFKYEEGIIHSDVLRIRVDKNIVNPCFIVYQLHFSNAIKQQIKVISSGAIMAGINVTKLKGINVHVPSLKDQCKFSDFIDEINKSRLAIQKSLDETQLLFDSLMQKYFG